MPSAEWERFVARVEALKRMKGFKKRNDWLKDAAARKERFRNRNFGDTRYAARVVTEILKLLYAEEKRAPRRAASAASSRGRVR